MRAGDRAEEVEEVLRRFRAWAAVRPDVRALALVGSWARGEPRPGSDVDLVLLSTDPGRYVDDDDDDWLGEVGALSVLGTRPWGAITERRLLLDGGLELDLGVGGPSWASVDPVDPGTRRVASEGLRPLHDPDGLLARLSEACG